MPTIFRLIVQNPRTPSVNEGDTKVKSGEGDHFNCRENEYSIEPHKLDSVGATPTAATISTGE